MSNRFGSVRSHLVQRERTAAISTRLLVAETALILLSLPLAASAFSGPGEAASHAKSQPVAKNAAPHTDYKVLIWYRKNDSLGTFKFEIYDVRKGEFTPEVDDWIKNIKAKYPAYYVALRDVDLSRELGATDLLRVGKVIDREVAVAAALAGVPYGPGGADSRPGGLGYFGGASAGGTSRASGIRRSPGSPRDDRDYLNRTTTPFPFPVPIPSRPR